MIDDERLSAYLDDELADDERVAVEHAIAADPSRRASLDDIARVRDAVRALGPVDPPFGFLEQMVSRGRRTRRLATIGAAVGSVAAAMVIVLGLLSGTSAARVVPPLRQYLDQHAVAATNAEPTGGFEPIDMSVARRDAPDMAPMQLMSAYHHDSVMQFVYDGASMGPMSLFVQSGRCDCGRLSGGVMMPMPGYADAWHGTEAQGRSVVVREGRLDGEAVVFTVIGRASSDADVVAVARHLG